MRKRLGSVEKAPIEKLTNGLINNLLTVVGLGIAFLLIYFGGNLAVSMINFLAKESEAGFVVDPNSQNVYIAKGIVAVLTAIFMLKK